MTSFDEPEIYRGILENLPTGLCVVNMQKKILFWSSGAERITGHLHHEVIGRSCAAQPLAHCDHPACEFCGDKSPVARAIMTSHPVEATGFLHHKQGHEVPVRIRAVPVHNGHGSIIGAVETFEELQPAANRDGTEPIYQAPDCVDAVTGVANRPRMHAHLRQTLLMLSDGAIAFGVLLLKLQGLTHFRARLGPEAASSLLRIVARTLESSIWTTDVVGRWSDDQFLVIVNGCHPEGIPAVCERMRRMLAGEGIEWWGERHSLPVLIGETTAQAGDTVESLVERVQKSLGTASAGGGSETAAAGYSSPGS